MSQDGEWASHIELVALSTMMGIAVLITTDGEEEENFQVWIYPPKLQTDVVILLGYSQISAHYCSLQGINYCYHNIIKAYYVIIMVYIQNGIHTYTFFSSCGRCKWKWK